MTTDHYVVLVGTKCSRLSVLLRYEPLRAIATELLSVSMMYAMLRPSIYTWIFFMSSIRNRCRCQIRELRLHRYVVNAHVSLLHDLAGVEVPQSHVFST